MNSHAQTSVCRRCRYYEPEGRRGGHCRQLNVAVHGAWTACALAIPPFSPAWETFEDIMVWQQKTLAALQESTQVDALEAALSSDEAVVTSLNDRSAADVSFSSTTPCRLTSPVLAEPSQARGIKALWM